MQNIYLYICSYRISHTMLRYPLNFSAHGIVNLRYFPSFKYGWIRLLSSVFPSLFAARLFSSPFPIILKQNIFPSLFYSFTTDSILLPHIVSSSIFARFHSSFLLTFYTSKGFELNVLIFNKIFLWFRNKIYTKGLNMLFVFQ